MDEGKESEAQRRASFDASPTMPIGGLFFEDFVVGASFRSPSRTIGEADITLFSMLSGDWNALHSDAVYAATSPFGHRIGHGALGIAIATGLLTRLGLFEGTAVALLNLREWQFRAPIAMGATLHVDLEIVAARLTRSGGAGVIDRKITLRDSDDTVIQDGLSEIMVAFRGVANIGKNGESG